MYISHITSHIAVDRIPLHAFFELDIHSQQEQSDPSRHNFAKHAGHPRCEIRTRRCAIGGSDAQRLRRATRFQKAFQRQGYHRLGGPSRTLVGERRRDHRDGHERKSSEGKQLSHRQERRQESDCR